jgi:hypothetical protein
VASTDGGAPVGGGPLSECGGEAGGGRNTGKSGMLMSRGASQKWLADILG